MDNILFSLNPSKADFSWKALSAAEHMLKRGEGSDEVKHNLFNFRVGCFDHQLLLPHLEVLKLDSDTPNKDGGSICKKEGR